MKKYFTFEVQVRRWDRVMLKNFLAQKPYICNMHDLYFHWLRFWTTKMCEGGSGRQTINPPPGKVAHFFGSAFSLFGSVSSLLAQHLHFRLGIFTFWLKIFTTFLSGWSPSSAQCPWDLTMVGTKSRYRRLLSLHLAKRFICSYSSWPNCIFSSTWLISQDGLMAQTM